MDEEPRPVSPTIRRHKRQMTWQILLPFAGMALLLIAAAVLVAGAGAGKVALWRDVSLIWLLVPALILALFLLVILGLVIYALARLKQATPRFTARAQELTLLGAQGIRRIADGTTLPFIRVRQVGAGIRSIFRRHRR